MGERGCIDEKDEGVLYLWAELRSRFNFDCVPSVEVPNSSSRSNGPAKEGQRA